MKIDDFLKLKGWYDEKSDSPYHLLPKKMPLKYMQEIKFDKLMSSEMLGKWGWGEVRKAVKEGSIPPNGDVYDEYLADGFIEFQNIWMDDNAIDIMCLQDPNEIRNGREIFYDETGDSYCYFNGDLYKELLERYIEVLIGD